MRAYIIKHIGKTNWGNMLFESEITFTNKKIIHTGILFFRKKDAKLYLETFEYKEFYEVVGVMIEKSNFDNRRLKV
jgi:hypothetical protein